jgi:transposase
MQVTTIGLDIAKNVFQVHGIDAIEKVVIRKQLRRSQVLAVFKALPPCLVGMEACATAHYWARELTKLGHQVRLMPAKDVKAYVKRNKNDAADAEAICEAVRRPTMRFVQVKSAEQQGRLMLHRTRDLLMRQRTQVINALRAHLAELGMVAAQGREGIKELLKIIASEQDARLPVDAHASLVVLAAGLQAVQTMIGSIDKRIIVQHRSNEASKRLRTIPGIGIVGATAITATVTDPKVFRSGRDFAAWIGIVPREDSTGGKQKLGPRLKEFEIQEDIGEDTTESSRCLTDGRNCMWVYIQEDGRVGHVTRYGRNAPGKILNAIGKLFDTYMASEYEPEYWGFATQEEWDACWGKIYKEQPDEFYLDIIRYLKGKESNITPGTNGMTMAEIAKELIATDPSLLLVENKERLLKEVDAIFFRDHAVTVTLSPEDIARAELIATHEDDLPQA